MENKKDDMHQDLLKPMRLLLYEGKYALASITVVMTSMGFVMALSIRGMTSTCISYFMGTSSITSAMCVASVIEGFVSFILILIIAIIIIRTFVRVTANDIITFPQSTSL